MASWTDLEPYVETKFESDNVQANPKRTQKTTKSPVSKRIKLEKENQRDLNEPARNNKIDTAKLAKTVRSIRGERQEVSHNAEYHLGNEQPANLSIPDDRNAKKLLPASKNSTL
jgi:hypothetical protein